MRTTLIAVMALLALGCGGGDDDADDVIDDAGASGDAAIDDPADDAADAADEVVDDVVDDVVDAVDEAEGAAEDASQASGSGVNTATVTVGDQTFDFEWEIDSIHRCETNFFGGFWALDAAIDGGPSLEAQIWPDDAADPSQVSKIAVNDGDDSYTANPEPTAGATAESWPAQVDSFEIDGNTVTGTATFVANFIFGEEPEAVPGTFTITCTG